MVPISAPEVIKPLLTLQGAKTKRRYPGNADQHLAQILYDVIEPVRPMILIRD